MKGNPFSRGGAAVIAISLLIYGPVPAATAKSAKHMTDLVGARASSGENALEDRGFTHIATSSGHHHTLHSYWWNSHDKNCLHVETRDGRYSAITDGTRSDCHQKGGDNTAVAVGAVAGAAVLAALLSHKSHDHKDGQHLADQRQEEQYDRGYTDGLHNVSYHNYDRADAYADGYQAGVDQRSRNVKHHMGSGGYASAVRISDIQGRDSVWAFDEMRNRGFASVDSMTSGNTTYGIYYNRSTRQCVQITNADSQVYDIRDIGQHPNCH
jgi:hypothetical protein